MSPEGGDENGDKPPDDEPASRERVARPREGAGSSRPVFETPPSVDTAWGGSSGEPDSGWPRRPDFQHRGRVTIDFSGPPLELPSSEGTPIDESSGELTLDTSGMESAPPPAEPPRARRSSQPEGLITETGDDDSLELDLTGLEAKPPPGPIASDAWILDRRHRSSPPPSSGPKSVRKATPRPPIDPSRMRGKTNPAFPAAVSAGPPAPPPAPAAIGDSSEGDALGLVDRSAPADQDLDLVSDMAERYALGDFTGALRAAELLLGISPEHAEASRYARSSRERLEQLFTSRLGPLSRIPRVAIPDHEIRWLGLDHRAGFLLSRVDGCHTLEEILDVSGMPRLEALKTLSELVGAGTVRLEDT